MDPTTLYVLVHCFGAYCQPVAPYFSITHAECLRAQSERGADYRCYSQWHDQIVPDDKPRAKPDFLDMWGPPGQN
jgi:hypothetical protein